MNQWQKREFVSAKKWAHEHDMGGRTAIRIPPGMGLLKIDKTGTINLDFAPYVVGKGNPRADEGQLYFERTYFAHFSVGSHNAVYLCPSKMSGGKKPCPICEDSKRIWSRDDLDNDQKKELTKTMIPKERQLFIVKDARDKEAQWMLWDLSYHNFGKLLKMRLDNAPEESDFDMFAHPEKGYTLAITIVEETTGSSKYKRAGIIDFLPRKKPLDIDIDSMPCLDELLIIPTYEELRKVYLQLGDDDEDNAPKAKSSPADRLSDTKKASNGNGVSRATKAATTHEDDDQNDDAPPARSRSQAAETPRASSKVRQTVQEETDEDEPTPPDWCGLGKLVYYKGKECEVKRVSRDGKSLKLEADDGEEFSGVDPSKCKPYEEVAKAQVKASPHNEPDDDDDDDQPPPPRRGR